ncbi:hypothetical protein WR25_10784 [Diploscapter pachys]|uniref:G-protein coupled receptors family 1 profile domain-containing protein n=1 Tax=Diploscapter pachys TaxID=2018661 RepID=A0A2A2JBD9_9BILA|nr:hypothetical protein WR25_10784 [Diploscapter pachys]
MSNESSAEVLALGLQQSQQGIFEGITHDLVLTVLLASILSVLTIACVIGNVFVLLAIVMERDLRGRPQSYLIFSLACADLIVGTIVMPLGAYNTITGQWKLGVLLCDIWISVDVLVCTASILHLVAIALDRYWSVTDISYVQNRTPRRIVGMLVAIWTTSLLISLAPFAGWKDKNFVDRVNKQYTCLISQEISYQVFSTATAFYIPLIAIICVYWKIMRAAKKRFKRERDRRTLFINATLSDEKLTKSAVSFNSNSNGKVKNVSDIQNGSRFESTSTTQSEEDKTTQAIETIERTRDGEPHGLGGGELRKSKKRKKRKHETTIETKREKKAWRTLAIITGTFIACWTPFFLISLYRPICRCQILPALELITTWLGYLNSVLNFIIYTVFSPDFRAAFKKIAKRICLVTEF